MLSIVLLLLLPDKEEAGRAIVAEEKSGDSGDYREAAIGRLSGSERSALASLEKAAADEKDALTKIGLCDSLSRFWESKGELLLAADELHRVAEIMPDKASYFIAGDKYYAAFKNAGQDSGKIALGQAIACYNKVLELLPGDLEARTSLGVCYVEGAAQLGQPPMKGIGMLTDVLKDDPDNINAMVNLGYFAIQSGQLDKAAERFSRILEIDSTFTDAYLYLSDINLKKGDREEALKHLMRYRKFVDDPSKLEQLDIYINQVRNNSI